MATATQEKFRIERKQAEAVTTWAGWATSATWPDERMAQKLKNVKATRPDEDPPAELADLVLDVEAAIERGQEFEVYHAEEAPAAGNIGDGGAAVGALEEPPTEEPAAPPLATPAAEAPKKKRGGGRRKKKADEPKSEEPKEEAATATTADGGEAPAGKTPEEPKVEKTAEPAKPKLMNIRPTMSRKYLAGHVLREFGLQGGVTREMMERVNELAGKKNDDQSWAALAHAWHALNGYLGAYPVSGAAAE